MMFVSSVIRRNQDQMNHWLTYIFVLSLTGFCSTFYLPDWKNIFFLHKFVKSCTRSVKFLLDSSGGKTYFLTTVCLPIYNWDLSLQRNWLIEQSAYYFVFTESKLFRHYFVPVLCRTWSGFLPCKCKYCVVLPSKFYMLSALFS